MISFRTVQLRHVDLEDLQPDDLQITDIACALSKVCRFAGHVRIHYSVAQHSCLVASLVEERLRLPALLHDASEAYLGDLSRHLKHSEYLWGYRMLESYVQEQIEDRFAIGIRGHDDRHQIKVADDLAACFEHVTLRQGRTFTNEILLQLLEEQFVRSGSLDLAPMVPRLPASLVPWSYVEAENQFLLAFASYATA